MRKGLVNSAVSEQILRVVPFQRRLEIQKHAVIAVVARGVTDSAKVEVLADVSVLWHGVPCHPSNLHAKINPAAFHGIIKIGELVTRIGRSVASNNQLAPPAHEFVHCQILEVTSVRQVDVFTLIARRAEEFSQKTQETQDRKSTRLNSSHVAISYAVFCL